MMEDYCAFSKDHKCLKWDAYELTRKRQINRVWS